MKKHIIALTLMAAFFWSAPAFAQNNIPQTVEEMKEMAKPEAKPSYERIKSLRVPAVRNRIVVEEKTIRVSPGKSKTVQLDRDAASVIVANPAHATVFLDTPRMLVVMPRAPGATQLTVLDGEGREILKKGILVDGAGDDHVRIRRICGTDERGRVIQCEAETIYYCPDDNCQKVAIQPPRFDSGYPRAVESASTRSSGSVDMEDSFYEEGGYSEPSSTAAAFIGLLQAIAGSGGNR